MKDRIREHYIANFDLLVKRYKRRCGGEMNAEDVVQEAYYRALKYSNSFREDVHKIESWIGTILNNCYRDFKAAERPVPHMVKEEGGGASSEDVLIQKLEVQKIKEEINKCNRTSRDILWLWYFQEYTLTDIHNVLDIPRSTVSMAIKRFRDKVRKQEEV